MKRGAEEKNFVVVNVLLRRHWGIGSCDFFVLFVPCLLCDSCQCVKPIRKRKKKSISIHLSKQFSSFAVVVAPVFLKVKIITNDDSFTIYVKHKHDFFLFADFCHSIFNVLIFIFCCTQRKKTSL